MILSGNLISTLLGSLNNLIKSETMRIHCGLWTESIAIFLGAIFSGNLILILLGVLNSC